MTSLRTRSRGTIIIDPERCKGCVLCVSVCPTHCIEMSSDTNSKGYVLPVLARPDDCTGCELCGRFCPDVAISVFRFAKGARPSS